MKTTLRNQFEAGVESRGGESINPILAARHQQRNETLTGETGERRDGHGRDVRYTKYRATQGTAELFGMPSARESTQSVAVAVDALQQAIHLQDGLARRRNDEPVATCHGQRCARVSVESERGEARVRNEAGPATRVKS